VKPGFEVRERNCGSIEVVDLREPAADVGKLLKVAPADVRNW
jgi:hypothetical protein